MIEASDLSKRYGAFIALDHVGFQVDKGRVAGFLGLNGAGKTTTLRIVSCYMPPTSGWVKVAGFDTVRQSDEVRRRIGYLPERVPLYEDLRVLEYLRFRARLKGLRGGAMRQAVADVVGRCGLEPKKKAIIGTLSKGYRQRVGIADALVHAPDLLLLDEPTSGLDPDQRIELRSLIRDLGTDRTVLLSTHILPEAEAVCDDVIVVHRGKIRAASRLDELRENQERTVLIRHGGAVLADYGPAGEDVSTEPGVDDCTTLTTTSVDGGSAIVAHIVAAGRPVLEMTPVTPTLEEIFIGLTTGREDLS
ncbi:MAG: ABC transporter [Planctomycetes bacterium]|nr:ABC transporter [Planctomycetota bacterium]